MEKIKSRNWIITRNISEGELLDAQSWLSSLYNQTKANYVIGQLERGLNEGRDHIQAYINYGNAKTAGGIKKYCNKMHIEVCRDAENSQRYCMKQETRVDGPWEYGEKPIQRNSKKDWEAVFLKAKQGRIEEIPADIRVRCYSQLKKIEKDHLEIRDASDVRGVWIYGKSGYGKSRLARRDYPDAYPKLCNKWWDGYNNQKYVIMDDIGPEHKMLGQQLKIWADRYGCILENKGGAMSSAYDTFVVTSQYSIEEIFGDDEKTVEALKRRFKVIHLPFKMDFDSGFELGLKEKPID